VTVGATRGSQTLDATGATERDAKSQGDEMAEAVANPKVEPISIPIREILPWAAFLGVMALLMIYFVGAEQGATSVISGHYVHEFVHDARHLLGFPCH
jgi:hypothetical protein